MIQTTLDTMNRMAATESAVADEVDGGHTVSPIDLGKASVAATQHGRTTVKNGGRWLIRLGLWELVCGMRILSQDYGLPWKARWNDHLDDPEWLGQAMAKTFMQLKPADKDIIRTIYDDWLWYQKTFDMQTLVVLEFTALCYLLDKDGKRVRSDNAPVTVLRGLKGQTKIEALATLDTRYYEFKEWW